MVRDATVALEDRSFYTSASTCAASAAVHLQPARQQRPGAGSITQQLVKNVLIDPEERYEQS